MTAWTESLRDPLRQVLRGGDWDRIEPARDGSWLALAHQEGGDGIEWYRWRDAEAPAPVYPLDDSRLPQVPDLVSEWLRTGTVVKLLAYKVGRRVLFRLGDGENARIAKVYRKARAIPERWRHLVDVREGGWSTPPVHEWNEKHRVLTIGLCPGESLNHKWLAHRGEPGDGDRVADLLRWLADREPGALPVHDVAEETRVLSERIPVYEDTLAAASPRAAELAHRVLDALAEESAPPVLCHRDFHDKQILLEPDRGSLIDLDLLAAGPPALDLGNILAHLRLRVLKGAKNPWQEIAGRMIEGQPAGLPAGSLPRWTAATLMRLALIYSRRRRGPTLLEDLLDSAAAALERSGEWRGIL